jgi:hypothetical protein
LWRRPRTKPGCGAKEIRRRRRRRRRRMDEMTDVSYTAQLAVFFRGIDMELNMIQELATLNINENDQCKCRFM